MIAKWDEKYCTGHVLVDAQHREIFALTRELVEAIVEKRGRTVIGEAMTRIDLYVQEHFTEEERLMRRSCFPRLEHHAGLHQAFRARAAELSRAFHAGELVLPLTVSQFLVNWLDTHIRTEDQALVQWLRTGKLPEGPGRAAPPARKVPALD